MRATISAGPPAVNPTFIVMGRVGYVCAHASDETAVSAAAPAATCRKFRREEFMACAFSRYGRDGWVSRPMHRDREPDAVRLAFGIEKYK
jgi:hypothetical protein